MRRFLLRALWLAPCLCMFTSTASASLVISELYYDAVGGDSGLVFVELYGTPGTSLDGIQLRGINGSNGSLYKTVHLSGIVPADGVFVIGDEQSGVTSVSNVDLIADVDFQNGPDSVILATASDILDAVGYGDFAGASFAGEGVAVSGAPAGSSLTRLMPWLDTDNNSLDFVISAEPTPGTVPVQLTSAVPVPEVCG